MMTDVAKSFGVEYFDCLTGFKNIAKVIRAEEAKGKTYIGGGEDSFGFLAGSFLRDKDGVSACSLAAEAAAWCRDTKGVTLYEWLQDLYVKFGFYREGLVNVVREGKDGAELIQNMMVEYRANPPQTILGSKVVEIYDYKTLELKNTVTGEVCPIPEIEDKSNVLQ
jgi:phosphoglucomutase